MTQLEDEKEDLERRLDQEKSACLLQKQMNEEQVKYQQSLSKDIKESDAEVSETKHNNYWSWITN